MKKEIEEQFPKWCSDTNKYNLCLTDDLDSLFSCILLGEIKGYEITHFYTFSTLYKMEDYVKRQSIGVDMDLTYNGKCWGNHVTLNTNYNCANINNILNISKENYTEKFCGSTVLQILSFYHDYYEFSDFSMEEKMVLLAIDSTFLGYWFNNGYYCKEYLKMLEFDDLLDILNTHSKSDFEEISRKYNLKDKIYIQNGKLTTNIDLKALSKLFNLSFLLPTDNFTEIRKFETFKSSYIKPEHRDKIYSLAITRKNEYKYSI